jgi:hypothetical protein
LLPPPPCPNRCISYSAATVTFNKLQTYTVDGNFERHPNKFMMKYFFMGFLFFCATIVTAQVSNKLTAAEKVYGLSKFWQEVNYNFVPLSKVSDFVRPMLRSPDRQM